MSRVIYNNKRLIPAPLINITKNYATAPNGEKLGSDFNITVNGTMIAYMGSPNSQGTFWTLGGYPSGEVLQENERLGAILRKQEAVRNLFSDGGLPFSIQSEDASAPLTFYPVINSITFDQDIWYDTCKYQIEMTAPALFLSGMPLGEDDFELYINDATETWSLSQLEDQTDIDGGSYTYQLTHSVSAVGKPAYTSNGQLISAWQQARAWVLPKLGLDSSFLASSGVRNLPSYFTGYNHIRSEEIDEMAGRYGVTETWTISSGTATEDLTVSINTDIKDSLKKVSVNGTIKGMEIRNSGMAVSTTKFQSALSKFNIVSGLALSRAQNYAGINLNIVPVTTVVSKNINQGVIEYTFEYDDRPSNLVSGALSESITVQDGLRTDYPATIFVIGRANGPVIQDLATSKELTRQLSIELVMPKPSGTVSQRLASKPDVSGIVEDVAPEGVIKLVRDNQDNWDLVNGRFTREVTWVYEV